MTEETKSLLDAVSAAIDGSAETATPAATATPEETPDGDAAAAESDDTSTGADGGESDGETGGGDDAAGTGADGETDKGADAGKVPDSAKPKEGEKGAEGAAPKTDAEKAAEAAKAKKADPVNDPFDNRWKENTRTRVQSLVDMVKQRDSQLEQANTLFDAIDDTGMGPEELASMLGYARARHHGTPEQKQAAYKFLKDELRAIALELGETDTVDFLADHADLQEAVAANTITAEYAKEVALARSRAARDTATAAATTQQTAAQQAHASGVQALNTIGAALAKRDGAAAFLAKKDVLVATLKPIFAQIPPSQWAKTFQQAYDAMPKQAAAVAPVSTTPPVKTPQPLRPGTPAGGGGKKEPKNMQEAVFAAFDTQE